MSSDASLTRDWPDEERDFRLAIRQLRELQDRCGAGPIEILDRLVQRRWRAEDVRETIMLGLLGGDMGLPEASRLVRDHVDGRPLAESVPLARDILLAAVIGVPDDPVGKPASGEVMGGSSSPLSTEPGSLWGGRPASSTP